MIELEKTVDRLARDCGAATAPERELVGEYLAVYRLLQAQTPQWLRTLHMAFRAGSIACTPAALGDLKALALRDSGAGEAVWRRLHPLGDRAFEQRALVPGVHNLVVLLRLAALGPPGIVPDPRLVDALCDGADSEPRRLPARDRLPPAAIVAAATRALHRCPADLGECDLALRTQVRQVFEWAHHDFAAAGALAVQRGWARLVRAACVWLQQNPGRGVPSALPLHVRAGHLEAVQLRTPVALAREALRMDNCLDRPEIAARLRRRDWALYSIRSRTERRTVADLSLAYWPRSRRWAVEQVQGPGNGEPAPEVRAFARALCAAVSPCVALKRPKALPADAEAWALRHPDPNSARLAARFAMAVARGRLEWIAPYVTRLSHYRGGLGVTTVGDELLEGWRSEFCVPRGRPGRAVRVLRLPTDRDGQPCCVFDVGGGVRAIAFHGAPDGRLMFAAETRDPDLLRAPSTGLGR